MIVLWDYAVHAREQEIMPRLSVHAEGLCGRSISYPGNRSFSVLRMTFEILTEAGPIVAFAVMHTSVDIAS
jgi:hypothetical protein